MKFLGFRNNTTGKIAINFLPSVYKCPIINLLGHFSWEKMLSKDLKCVYRLEYADARGFYCKLGKRGWKGAGHRVLKNNHEQHPNPFGDLKLMTGLVDHGKQLEDCFFCFSSVKALRAWVNRDEWLLGLHNLGVKLAVYTCEKSCIIEGEKQSLFYSSVRKRQYNLAKYFDIEQI